ncbi:MAG: putative membrane protein [Candidatus Wolfebacteria bacterium GW2011_GWA2_42_10]|uniref:Protease PrsW n=2 Tax=Candidatus Wolfeibacteriota TaxID=1752735 RepID=A0A0G0XL39_9BACT|nr:MAG: putative membrane protein [Candidatus Wolfebacteria bacterium GW2011_GWA2_42_10]
MVILFAVIFGLLPSFVWLIFFLKEDIHPEPKKMIARIFLDGALIALAAVVFQFFLREFFEYLKISHYGIFSFFVFGASEEILKFLVVYLAVYKNKFFDEPIDAMMYMVTAALGFAALENIFVVFGNFAGQHLELAEVLGIVTFRFAGATLLHVLSSAIIGYYWAKGLTRETMKLANRRTIFYGFVIASLLHGIFNYSILIFSPILIFPTMLLIIVALFIFWDFEKIKSNY